MKKLIAGSGVVALLSFGILAAWQAPVQAASTLVVTTTADENGSASDCTDNNPATACSVREALAAATADGDTVQLQVGVTYTLAHGQLDHGDTSVTIEGNGSVVDAGGSSRAFVQGTGTFSITDLLITGTHAQSLIDENGGAIEAGGDVVLTSAQIQGGDLKSDTATARGGAIYAAGDVTLTDSDINAIQITSGLGNAWGGAIYATGAVTLTGSTVHAITASGDGFGGAIYAGGAVSMTSSTVDQSGGVAITGGGVYAAGPITLVASTVAGNSGRQGGGLESESTVTITSGSAVSGNTVFWQSDAFGGGVYAGGDVTVSDSTVSDNVTTYNNNNIPAGTIGGGGIYALGSVTLDGATLTDNQVAIANSTEGGYGGGVHAVGTVSVIGSVVSGNNICNCLPGTTATATAGATTAGGAPVSVAETPSEFGGPKYIGGGISSDNTVTVVGSQFTGNLAMLGGALAGPRVVVTASAFAGNTAEGPDNVAFSGTIGWGGAIYASESADLTDVTIQGSQAVDDGGALWVGGTATIEGSLLVGNTAGGLGGGLYAENATLQGTTIALNTSQWGGGAYTTGSLAGTDLWVTGNHAIGGNGFQGQGGGIWSAAVALTDSAVTFNTAGPDGTGGGVYSTGSVALTNTTVAGNLATNDPNQFPPTGTGGGVAAGSVTARFSTIADNQAASGANVSATSLDSAATVVAYAAGGGGNCAVGSTSSAGYSYDDDGSCGFTARHDVSGGPDPQLGPIGDNGGGTPTMHPLPGSPLVDAIPNGSCTGCVATDQRGITRPQGRGYDIGAVEVLGVLVSPRFTG